MVKLISDGTPHGTKLFSSKGEEIDIGEASGVSWTLNAAGLGEIVVRFGFAAIDAQVDTEGDDGAA